MNANLLRAKCVEKNITFEKLAKFLGISTVSLYRKKSGESDFTRREIQIIRTVLELTSNEVDLIFFTD